MREILSTGRSAEFDELFTLSPELFRLRYYGGRISKEYTETVLYADEEKICFSTNKHTLYISTTGKPFTKRKTLSGLTYDKKTKKAKFWFGKTHSLSERELSGLKTHLGIDTEWLNDLSYHGIHTILSNPTIIGKIISGKITSCREMIKQYVKTSARGLNISPEVVYKYLKNREWGTNLKLLFSHAKVCVHPDDVFSDKCRIEEDYTIKDMLNQAKRLGKKLDLKWSEKRMKQVHAEWTREIMGIELKYLEERTVRMIGELKLLPGFELVVNQKRCFEIGSIEKHCVYTNFWSRIAKKDLYIIYGKYEGKMYTCSIEKNNYPELTREPVELQGNDEFLPDPPLKWRIGQLQAIGNTGAPQELHKLITEWIKRSSNIQFFEDNYRKEPITAHTTDLMTAVVNPRVQQFAEPDYF